MKEEELIEPPYEQTHDYVTRTWGPSWARGAFGVRIYEKPGAIPVVIASEAPDGHSAGVAPITQYLAADVLAKHFSRRLWEERPLRWVEAETRVRKKKDELVEREEYREVEFRSFLPRRVKVFGEKVLQIDEATRRRLKVKELEAFLGRKLA